MKLYAPSDRSLHRAFRIGDGPSPSGPRLGGRAPDLPGLVLEHDSTYLLTIPLAVEPPLYASLFRTCSIDQFIDAMNERFFSDSRIVAIVHEDVPRRSDDAFLSEVTPHPIDLLAEAPDLETTPDGRTVPNSGHKLGGSPFCLQEPALPGSSGLFRKGFVQVLQIDTPGANDGQVDGDWPFAGGLFNLFWKPPFHGVPYHWYFQG